MKTEITITDEPAISSNGMLGDENLSFLRRVKRAERKPEKDGRYITYDSRTGYCVEEFHDGDFWEKHNILRCYPDYWMEEFTPKKIKVEYYDVLAG